MKKCFDWLTAIPDDTRVGMAYEGWRCVCALFLAALLAGCSSDVEPGADDGELSLDEFLAGNSAALCKWSVRCGLLPDAQSCDAVGLSDSAQLEADVTSGVVEYKASLAPGCLEYAASDAYQSCGTSDDVGYEQACGGVLVGTLAVGKSCFYSTQCVETAHCDTSMCDADAACCAGTCVHAGAAGAPCSGSVECAEDRYCGEGGTCQTRAAVGSMCSDSIRCARGSFCGTVADSTTGVCVAFVGLGEACEPDWFNCADLDAWCSPATKTCVPAAKVGGPCTEYGGCLLDAYCDGASCQALPGVGEPCAEPGCLFYVACSAGICSPGPDEACPLP